MQPSASTAPRDRKRISCATTPTLDPNREYGHLAVVLLRANTVGFLSLRYLTDFEPHCFQRLRWARVFHSTWRQCGAKLRYMLPAPPISCWCGRSKNERKAAQVLSLVGWRLQPADLDDAESLLTRDLVIPALPFASWIAFSRFKSHCGTAESERRLS